MAKVSRQKIGAIQQDVFDWYREHKRDLPWRRTRDPYAILVSEIMLQQTQVNRVIPKYQAFLQEFPTVHALATTTPAAVIRAWKGLGYNRRALNLQRAATVVSESLNGQFPQTPDELQKLPGLGRYTAGAVATFAFDQIAPAVDTNVRQFIDVLLPTKLHRTEADYERIAARLIPRDNPGEWLHAVIDYTSLVLRPAGSRPKKKVVDNEPFIGSNRYLRGRTIDCLRDKPHSTQELYARVAEPVSVPQKRYAEILAALEKDGLLTRQSNHYQLTGDSIHD